MTNRIYLRVTENWQLIANPHESPLFAVNTSGVTMQVFPSPVEITNPSETILHPFYLGGSIGQVHIPANQYLYARAAMVRAWNVPVDQEETVIPEVPENAIVVIDETPVSPSEQADINATLAQLQTEIMLLTNRVNANSIERIKHKEEFIFFQRHMYNVILGLQNDHAANANRILDLNMRLFAAEMFIVEYRQKFANVEIEIEGILNSTEMTETIATIKHQISVVENTTNAVISRMNTISPKLEQAEMAVAEIKNMSINTLRADIAEVSDNLAALNNALVTLAAEHDAEALQTAFEELTAAAPAEMVGPIDAIRSIVMRLNSSLENDARQDEQIDSKVDRDDTVILTGDLDIAELAGS